VAVHYRTTSYGQHLTRNLWAFPVSPFLVATPVKRLNKENKRFCTFFPPVLSRCSGHIHHQFEIFIIHAGSFFTFISHANGTTLVESTLLAFSAHEGVHLTLSVTLALILQTFFDASSKETFEEK